MSCLDDKGVEYRQTGDHREAEFWIVDAMDPEVSELSRLCTRVTSSPADPAMAAYGNAMTTAIAECLLTRGYAVRLSDDSGFVSSDGSATVTFHLSAAQRQKAGYQADENECVAVALEAIPNPAE